MTMTELWREFRDRLTVRVEPRADPQDPSQAILTFTITNETDPGTQSPDIVFSNVTLHVPLGGYTADVPVGNLAARQTATREHRVSYADMPGFEWSLDADLSPEAFFHFQRAGRIAGTPVVPPEVYLAEVERLDVGVWADIVVASVSAPNADWTLGQVEEVAEGLSTARAEAQATGKWIEALAGLVATGSESGRQLLADHRKAMGDFLQEMVTGLSAIEGSLRGPNSTNTVPPVVERARNRLARQAQKVEDAASRLREAKR